MRIHMFLLVILMAAVPSQAEEWRCVTEAPPSPYAKTPGCPLEGPCDDPVNRDAAIPQPGDPVKTVRVRFVVFAEDDGSNPAATAQEVSDELALMNAEFAPHNIQFVATTAFVNDSTFRTDVPGADVDLMKQTYAVNPQTQVHVWVTDYPAGLGGLAVVPWDPVALTALGGMQVDDDRFGTGQKLILHEMGHTLGLWHLHHGTFEVPLCSPCFELADGSNGDVSGDFCSDTPPSPAGCPPSPPGTGPCTGVAYPPAQPENYMIPYGPDPVCWDQGLFTVQQGGRMNCWIEDKLTTWLDGAGDVNSDGSVDIADSVFLLQYLFVGGAAPSPLCQGGVNGDSDVDIADAVYLMAYLFTGGPGPILACP